MSEHELSHVFWIGGGSGAGKSTLSAQLAERFGADVYSTDKAIKDHSARCSASECPLLEDFKAMSMDERWADRSPEEMLATFQRFEGECFDLIVDDLRQYPRDRLIIVEGFRLLPRLVKRHLPSRRHGLWLLPTPDFRLAAFRERGSLWTIANKTTKPEKALDNLLTRDGMFTDQIAAEAEALGLSTLTMDGSLDQNKAGIKVAESLGLAAT